MQNTEGVNQITKGTKSILAQKEEELRALEKQEQELIRTEKMINAQRETEEK